MKQFILATILSLIFLGAASAQTGPPIFKATASYPCVPAEIILRVLDDTIVTREVIGRTENGIYEVWRSENKGQKKWSLFMLANGLICRIDGGSDQLMFELPDLGDEHLDKLK